MKYVISTLTADNSYTGWVNNNGMLNVAHSVLVRGGTGVNTKALVTPQGVSTPVSDEDAEFLKNNAHFKFHQERGFVKIISMDKNPESVAQSMSKDEGSRPRNEDDVASYSKNKRLDKDEKLQVVTNKR